MITRADIREVLADCAAMGLPKDLDDETPLVLDSLAATWIQHMLAERHGVQVSLTHAAFQSIDSVQALHEFVIRSVAGT
jgi:acyl carrier protein